MYVRICECYHEAAPVLANLAELTYNFGAVIGRVSIGEEGEINGGKLKFGITWICSVVRAVLHGEVVCARDHRGEAC